jgi:hypothetical protein
VAQHHTGESLSAEVASARDITCHDFKVITPANEYTRHVFIGISAANKYTPDVNVGSRDMTSLAALVPLIECRE